MNNKTNGRPSYSPGSEDRERVRVMASVGIPQDQIAKLLHVAPKTLRKHFRDELDLAAITANSAVLSSLFDLATERHNASAAIFWAKTRCGFRPGCDPLDSASTVSKPSPKPDASPTAEPPPIPELTFHINDGEPNER